MATKKNKTNKPQDERVDALLSEGTVTLKADSREAIYQEAEQLVALIPADAKWTRDAVEYCDGSFFQKYKLIKK